MQPRAHGFRRNGTPSTALLAQIHVPEFGLSQQLVYSAPASALDERRGGTMLVNKLHEPPIKPPAEDADTSVDTRSTIRRHYKLSEEERRRQAAAELRAAQEVSDRCLVPSAAEPRPRRLARTD
jgi:hypothetical protein